jgi:hypothetical protein
MGGGGGGGGQNIFRTFAENRSTTGEQFFYPVTPEAAS